MGGEKAINYKYILYNQHKYFIFYTYDFLKETQKTIRILHLIFWVTLKAVYCTYNEMQGAQQHSSGLVLDLGVHTEWRLPISGVHPIPSLPMYVLCVSDHADRHSCSIWTSGFHVKNVFPFPLSIRQIIGDFFNNRQCTPNRVHLSYNVHCLMALE